MSTNADPNDTPTPPGPLTGVAVYTMYRGDLTQLLQWCNFHLNAGASRLYVVLDRPSPESVSELPDDPRMHWEVMDQPTWDACYPRTSQNVEAKQVGAFLWMARRAVAEGHSFLAMVDADELIALSEPFTDIAARFPDAPAITLQVREMWYAETDETTDPFAATLAVQGCPARAVNWGQAFGWRAQFLRDGVLGHVAGKSIYRLPMSTNDISVHHPRGGPAAALTEELPATSGGLLHFDCGSLATWNAKWSARIGGGTVAAGLGPQRQAQQHLFSHALRRSPQQQEAFYRAFFSLSEQTQRRLEADGLLERVDVSAHLLGPLLPPATRADEGLVRLPPAARRVTYQFAMVCDTRFVGPTFATMTSVLANLGDKGSVRFVILGDGLDGGDVSHLRTLEHTAYDVEVVIHDITADLDRDVGSEDSKRATFGRIYLIDYLPEQRTVYLDGDVLATRDFAELFDLDMGTSCLAGVPDSAALRLAANPNGVPIEQRNRLVGITGDDPLEYLNGGVLVLDLDNPDFWGLALRSRALVVAQGRALKQRDQDAMNIAFAGRKLRLDSKYNYMTQFYVSDRCLDGDLTTRKYEAADASLVHFSGKIKPWEAAQAEFYNGLYRRLVADAEQRVGVSCGFYFSRPAPPPRREWTARQWEEVLESSPTLPSHGKAVPDITVLDLCDTGAFLQLSPAMYEFALAADLKLVAYAHGTTLFAVPLDRLGPPQAQLAERLGPGVRRLPFDLGEALAPHAGVARGVELILSRHSAESDVGFVRSVGVFGIVAAGSTATSELLAEAGVDGQLESLEGGSLSGWFRPRAVRAGERVSLYIDGELLASRTPTLHRTDLTGDERIRGFSFNISRLLAMRYASEGELSVRVAGANIPLRGAPLTVTDVARDLRYDVARNAWAEAPSRRLSVLDRVRRRMARP